MRNVMTKVIIFALAVLTIMAALAIPAFAEEVTLEAVTEKVSATAEEISEVAADTNVGETEPAETMTEAVTEIVTEPAETETSVPLDEWLYEAIKQATPEQVEMIEEIVMGGLNALDKLGIKGFDRVRIWVEYNTATVMVIALAVALVLFFVGTMLQKRGFAKKSEKLHTDGKDFYKAGQAKLEIAKKACENCQEAAEKAAKTAEEALKQLKEERGLLGAKMDGVTCATKSMMDELGYLLSCSDLSRPMRDEAEAIYQRGVDALRGYTEAPTEGTSKEVMADENNHQA